jgi:LCP family protein required for cell wall assembly
MAKRDAKPLPPQPHGRLTRLFVGASAALSLLICAGGAYAFVTYQAAKGVGVDTDFGRTDQGRPTPERAVGPCVENVCNYLILGSDSRLGLSAEEQVQFGTDQQIGGENRSDTIMLVHTDPRRQEVVVLSFPRDLWVEIPGHGFGKINEAFRGGVTEGGPELVAKTIHKLTGLRINHFVYVDLAGFQGVVDTLGGVEMCIPTDMADPLTGLDLKAGCQILAGDQALAYVRTRHLPCDAIPDFARIGRQQQFLRAVINRMLRPSELVRVPSLIRPILSNMRRDAELTPADLAFLVGQLRGVSTGAAEFRAVPGTPGWQGDLSVVQMDPSANQIFEALRDGGPLPSVGSELPGTPPSEANIVVPVVDHGSGGKAAGVESILSDGGFDVSPGIVAYATFGVDVSGSVIAYRHGHEVEAQVLAKYFPNLGLVPAKLPAGAPVAVFVTPSYEPEPLGDPGTSLDCVDVYA